MVKIDVPGLFRQFAEDVDKHSIKCAVHNFWNVPTDEPYECICDKETN